MDLTITAKNLTVDNSIDRYARKRLAKVDRRLKGSVPAKLVVRYESARDADERYIAEFTADLKGAFLRAEERAATAEAAVDGVSDIVDKQARRYKTRRRKRRTGVSKLEAQIAEHLLEIETEEGTPELLEDGQLVKVKRHPVGPMSVSEAAAQMDLVGHNFFLFINEESRQLNVVYRRDDGDYGLIVPEGAATTVGY